MEFNKNKSKRYGSATTIRYSWHASSTLRLLVAIVASFGRSADFTLGKFTKDLLPIPKWNACLCMECGVGGHSVCCVQYLLQHICFAQMQLTKYAGAQFLDDDQRLTWKLLHLAIGPLLVNVGEICAHIQIVMMRFAYAHHPTGGRGRSRSRRTKGSTTLGSRRRHWHWFAANWRCCVIFLRRRWHGRRR